MVVERSQDKYSESAQSESRYYLVDEDNHFNNASTTNIEPWAPVFEGISRTFFAYGDGFSSSEASATIGSEDYTINVDMTDDVSGAQERYSIHYTTFDLAGSTVADSIQATSAKLGIQTPFSKFDKLPSEVAFPQDSLCFVPTYRVASSPLFLNYPSGEKPSPPTLDNWEENFVSDDRADQTIIMSRVGTNNSIDARAAVATDNDGVLSTKGALNFGESSSQDLRYMNDQGVSNYYNIEISTYVPSQKLYSNSNIDPQSGLVYCELINDTAADFLETQIVQYY